MSATLGMPSATPSNASGRSGVSEDQLGYIGKGILGTIEEGVGGTSSRQLYYGTGVAFYQAPSMQRSYGDDLRSFNVKSFGSRGMVTLARRWLEMGPTELYMTYPINYAWAGPEYHARYTPKTMMTATPSNATYAVNAAIPASDANSAGVSHLIGELACEVRSGPNILPTYFWSGGAGFAMLSMIELNMGGGGNIIFDRYTNLAMIMASTPTISMRRDLMKMAGGGLYYDHETDYSSLPVKFGLVPWLTDEGTGYNRNVANTGNQENGENVHYVYAPIEWDIHVPIKTPQTNFWNCLLSRKPIDTSCFASDLQYIISLANFYEFSDTGTGLAKCPYYFPPLNIAMSPAAIAAEVVSVRPFYHPCQLMPASTTIVSPGSYSAGVYTATRNDQFGVGAIPSGTSAGSGPVFFAGLQATPFTNSTPNNWPLPGQLPPGYFYTGGMFNQDFNWAAVFGLGAATAPPVITVSIWQAMTTTAPTFTTWKVANFNPRNRIAANPRIWCNDYRVCNGFIYGDYGKPRPKFATQGVVAESDNRYMKDANTVASGSSQTIDYPGYLTRMEFRNRSLKLTNPALSARMPLQTSPQGCVYYPFSYGFSQTYRIPESQNPWAVAGFHRWCSNQVLGTANSLVSGQTAVNPFQDTLAPSNKITQNIVMPANPCTSMLVTIYREKDRKFLGKNTQGSYSPALFWNGLNPVKCTLYDGGNIMFDYQSTCAFEFGSLVDRPDCFRIPFRGGLSQLDPKNILPSPWDGNTQSALSDVYPNALTRQYISSTAGYPYRSSRNPYYGGAQHGDRMTPIHCTEWYNCHILEFPFCMHEPLGREGTVQSTPSFAKTILRLEFFIDALLKPMRGLDDMYDQTTVVPPLWFSGEWNYVDFGGTALPYCNTAGTQASAVSLPYGQISFQSVSAPAGKAIPATANVANSVPNAYILDSPANFNAYSDDREPIVQSSRGNRVSNPYATISSSASSWNVNDGALMLSIVFVQNQVWTISPNRTSVLSARG